MIKHSSSLGVTHQQALSPQLRQALRLLQLPAADLQAEVSQMLAENPFLEELPQESPREADSEPEHLADERADSEGFETPDFLPTDIGPLWSDGASPGHRSPDADDGLESWRQQATEPDLRQHLHRQLGALRISDSDAAAVAFLIESLDDDGYLRDSLAQLAAVLVTDDDDMADMQLLLRRLDHARSLLQSLDPIGVGAEDLADCLRLQLECMQRQQPVEEAADTALALILCAHPQGLQIVAARDVAAAAVLLQSDEAAAWRAMVRIAGLTPRPAAAFGDTAAAPVVPDVVVRAHEEGGREYFVAQLNAGLLPRLSVQEQYARILRRSGESNQQLSAHLEQARWFVHNLNQRFDTILRVSQAITARQQNFFRYGPTALQPLVQQELAVELGVHESTISRATAGKYMVSPQGTFELKYFFSSALSSNSGTQTSSTAVQAHIRRLIQNETAGQALSDAQLSQALEALGIRCARRTVAKYREAMDIPVASVRDRRPLR